MALQEIRVPDLEGSQDVAVVEVYVSPGEIVENETPLISLESDKAVMDVPSPISGTIQEVKISEGDTVNTGDLIAMVETGADEEAEKAEETLETAQTASNEKKSPHADAPTSSQPSPSSDEAHVNSQPMGAVHHATPSVRAFARELGVELGRVSGSGPKGRITREDVSSLVKGVMSGTNPIPAAGTAAFTLPPIPTADFAAFGEIETEELSRIKRISGPHLHRNWIGVPHVTQFENADITDLEAFRKELNAENAGA